MHGQVRDIEKARLYRVGRWCVRHGKAVVIGWLAVAALVFGCAQWAGPHFESYYRVPHTQSEHVQEVLQKEFPALSGTDGSLVFHAGRGSLRSPQAARGMRETLERVRTQPGVAAVTGPSDAGGALDRSGRTGVATVRFDRVLDAAETGPLERLRAALTPARAAGLQVEIGGPVSQLGANKPSRIPEIIGVVGALAVLILTFGSVISAGLPVLTALVGLLTGTGLIFFASHQMSQMMEPSLAVASMIGLGAGIDYALFLVMRTREERARGATTEHAVGAAMATAGASVALAGGTVMVALLGLWVTGTPLIGAAGSAATIAVGAVLLASMTLLPALLGLLGGRIEARGSRTPAGKEHRWRALAEHVCHRPWRCLLAGTGIMLLVAAPALSIRIAMADDGAQSTEQSGRRAYDLVTSAFGPGLNGPLLVVAPLRGDGDRRTTEAAALARTVRAVPGVASVSRPLISRSGGTAVITAVSASRPGSPATADLVGRLRQVSTDSARPVAVGGFTAMSVDLADRVRDRLPWLIATVLAAALVLLIAVFRCLAVPVKAVLLNLLAVAAAYGALVVVFQWGWGGSLIGLADAQPIHPVVPAFLFALLFGLSMDYEVFLAGRIQEEYRNGAGTNASIVKGTAAASRLISAAALIMIVVFASFTLQPDPIVKMFGVGMGVAVLLDATVIRMLIMPAAMSLMGVYNWWMPTLRKPSPAATLPRQRRPSDGPGRHADVLQRKLTAAFHLIDRTGDGYLTADDLSGSARAFADRLGCDARRRAALEDGFARWWHQMETTMDVDGDGRVSLAEYLGAARHGILSSRDYTESGPGAAFAALAQAADTDADGTISRAEFGRLLGDDADSRTVDRGWRMLDLDRDGRVTLAEFTAAYQEFFSSDGRRAAGSHLLGLR